MRLSLHLPYLISIRFRLNRLISKINWKSYRFGTEWGWVRYPFIAILMPQMYPKRKGWMQFTRDSSDILGWLWVQDHGKCKRDTSHHSKCSINSLLSICQSFLTFLKSSYSAFWQFHRHMKFFFQYITNADSSDGISDKLSISTIEH